LEVITRFKIARRTLIDWLDAGLQAEDSVRREKILIHRGSFYELKKPDVSPWFNERRYPQPFSRRPYTVSYEEYLDAIERGIDLLNFKVSDIEKFRSEILNKLPSEQKRELKQIGQGETEKNEDADDQTIALALKNEGQQTKFLKILKEKQELDAVITLPKIAKVLDVSVETVKNRAKNGDLQLQKAANGQRWAERSYLITWKTIHLCRGKKT
jgi:hypothetical protein